MLPPSSAFTSFFRYLDSMSSLCSEVISTHSLWDVSGLLNCTSCTSVNWSQLTQLHRSLTLVTMCHVNGVSWCCPIVYPHRWSASCGKNVRNMQFEPPSWKTCLFTQFALLFQTLSLADFDFSSSWCRESPWTSLPLWSSVFQAGSHIGHQCNVVTFKPSVIKKSKSLVLIWK